MNHARQMRYSHTAYVGDTMLSGYRDECKRAGVPYINVHEHRKGYANIEVTLPADVAFDEEICKAIEAAGMAVGVNTNRRSLKICSLVTKDGIHPLRSMPTNVAIAFAEKLIPILEQRGMFDN